MPAVGVAPGLDPLEDGAPRGTGRPIRLPEHTRRCYAPGIPPPRSSAERLLSYSRMRRLIGTAVAIVLLCSCSTNESSSTGLPSDSEIVISAPALRIPCDSISSVQDLSQALGRDLQEAAIGHQVELGYSYCQYDEGGNPGNLSISFEVYSGRNDNGVVLGDPAEDARNRLNGEHFWNDDGGPFALEAGEWGFSGSGYGGLPHSVAIFGVSGVLVWLSDSINTTTDDDARSLAPFVADRLEALIEPEAQSRPSGGTSPTTALGSSADPGPESLRPDVPLERTLAAGTTARFDLIDSGIDVVEVAVTGSDGFAPDVRLIEGGEFLKSAQGAAGSIVTLSTPAAEGVLYQVEVRERTGASGDYTIRMYHEFFE